MSILDLFKRKPTAPAVQKIERDLGTSLLFGGSEFLNSTATSLKVAAVYRCAAVIAETLAQMPIIPYIVDKKGFKAPYSQHASYYLLGKAPNKIMTRFEFWQRIVYQVLFKGNGYAYIEREADNITPKALHYISADSVTVRLINDGRDVEYLVVGMPRPVESNDMLHFKGYPASDGYTGVSVLTYAREAIALADSTNKHAAGFFSGGANCAGILTVNGALTKDQRDAIKEAWQGAFNTSTGNPNGIAVLQGNMSFQNVSISPADAQMLESRQVNVLDICRYFGVSPTKCYDLTKASWATVEAENDAFLTETLNPWIDKISLELERKLYGPSERGRVDIEFDTTALLRSDRKTMADFYNTLFQMGCATPNEIRRRMNMPPIADGDTTFTQVNVMPLTKHFVEDDVEPSKDNNPHPAPDKNTQA